MNMKEISALHSSELMKLPYDSTDPNDDLWQLGLEIRSLREQLEEFEADCRRQMAVLEGLLHWCDDLLYQTCELYCRRREENPERQ